MNTEAKAIDWNAPRIELEHLPRGRVVTSSLAMRLRIHLDAIVHAAPASRVASVDVRASAPGILGITEIESEQLWVEISNSGLEQRIESELKRNIPPGRGVPLIATPSGPWLDILRFMYLVVRVRRPARAVETGVGPVGASTSFLLEAMRANGEGHLWSLDANRYLPFYGIEPGNGIP